MTCYLMDLGNSRYKWLDAAQMDPAHIQRASYVGGAANDTIAAIAESLKSAATPTTLQISSVKGDQFNTALTSACERAFNVTPYFCRSNSVSEFPSAYEDPQLLGVDRYLTLLAARKDYPKPSITVDAGTAITFDALDSSGKHIGGCIFPGLSLLGKSLLNDTARILSMADNQGELFGRSTAEGVAGGVHTGYFTAVEGIILRMQQQMGTKVTVICTGGDADSLQQQVNLPMTVDHLLIFKGIQLSANNQTT